MARRYDDPNPAPTAYVVVLLAVLLVGTVFALIYFFFSVPHRGPIGHMASAGIWIMMIGFGASFGYTVMARLSLLIGRVFFLLKDWLHLIS